MKAQKQHWENVYQTKTFENVSWFQPIPETLSELLRKFLHKIECLNFEYLTPFDTLQKFIFCQFQRREVNF